MRLLRPIAFALIAIAIATPAAAHTGVGDHIHLAFADGFKHPLNGFEHLLAMVGVGMWAAFVGGAARWAWPLAFVSVMAVGGASGLVGVGLPYVETAILSSVIGLGAAITFGLRVAIAAGAAICAAFALAHGYAHGAELPAGASAAGYVTGFLVATATLHGAGLALGTVFVRSPAFSRVAGASIAAAGAFLAFA